MSKIKLLTIAVIGLLVVNLGMVAFMILRKPPRPPRAGMEMQRRGPKNSIIERLQLDKAQITQYENLIKQHRSAILSLEDQMNTTKNKLYQTLASGNTTGKDSLIAHLGVLQTQIEQIHYDHFVALKQICKPEQLDNFNQLTSELASFFSPDKKNPLAPRN